MNAIFQIMYFKSICIIGKKWFYFFWTSELILRPNSKLKCQQWKHMQTFTIQMDIVFIHRNSTSGSIDTGTEIFMVIPQKALDFSFAVLFFSFSRKKILKKYLSLWVEVCLSANDAKRACILIRQLILRQSQMLHSERFSLCPRFLIMSAWVKVNRDD